jgi:hypothetical protein
LRAVGCREARAGFNPSFQAEVAMKSDRRHELQTNVLADWLGEHLESLRPHAMPIALVAIAIVALGLGSIWYFGNAGQTSAEAWMTYFGAFNQREPGKVLEHLADEKTSAAAALWARQSIGDLNLAQGTQRLFTDRIEAKKLLEFLNNDMLKDGKKQIRWDSGVGIKPISITGTKRLVRMAIKFALETGRSPSAPNEPSPGVRNAAKTRSLTAELRALAFA